jgi:cell division protein FtsQ
MDKKKSNIRLVKSGSERVTKNTAEYTKNTRNGNANSTVRKHSSKELREKVRYRKRQKQKKLKMQRRRALIIFLLVVIVVSVLLFLTPIFNIRSVSVEGNRLVSEEQFREKLKPLIGENLFRTGEGKIRKTLKTIQLIDEVDVQKKIFPPSVNVVVTEYVPAGMVKAEDRSILVDTALIALTDDGIEVTPVPQIVGFNVSSYQFGKEIKTDESEKKEALLTILKTLNSTGMIDKITEINVSDVANITMNYDNRISVTCGTQLGLERKIRLLHESVNSSELAENARGTMDLTETGKAVYIP